MEHMKHLLFIVVFFISISSGYSQLPPHTTDFRGLWITGFKDNVLGNVTAENELLQYAVDNDLNYLICTNTFQILTASCGSFTADMIALQAFIEKAHLTYGIEYISGNVGSSATGLKIQDYNNCSSVTGPQKFDMITYECEFYNPATNSSCPDFNSYITQLQTIRNACDTTFSSDPTETLVCEVYIGGSGSTGLVITNSSQIEVQEISNLSDHMLVTYYRTTPYQSSGNFFNWTIQRLEWIHNLDLPNKVVILLKSRNTDGNNMYNYLLTYPGSHFDALRAPYHSWVEGTVFDPLLTDGYIESYNSGTYPWLEGIEVGGFTWFEHEANMEISSMLSISDYETKWSAQISPNPANGYFEVLGVPDGSFQLFTIGGRLIETNETGEFDIAELSNGLYLVLISRNGQRQTQKLIIQN